MSDTAKKTCFHIGPIRPPSEANSLLLQVTAGCTWNKCKFCDIYRGSQFRAYQVDDIKADIDAMAALRDRAMQYRRPDGGWNMRQALAEMAGMDQDEQNCYWIVLNWLARGGKTVFLQDGNTLALTAKKLTEVLSYLKQTFPDIERITSYGRADTLAKVSVEEYRALHAVGLSRIHSGFESGSDAVLQKINKGSTQAQQITAGQNIKAAGIQFSMYFMPGVGGRALSAENATETAKVVRAVQPDFVRVRTAVMKRGSGLWDDWQAGLYQPCSENEKLQEIRTLIDETDGCDSHLVSDHVINLIQTLDGHLTHDRADLLGQIDEYFALPEETQRLYQIARRSGGIMSPAQLDALSADSLLKYEEALRSIPPGEKWEMALNDVMNGYI